MNNSPGAQPFNTHLGKEASLRLKVLQAVIVALFIIISFRLGQIQIVESQEYREIAQKQYESEIILPANRGIIYDRNMNVLASNSTFVSFGADPILAAINARTIAQRFSKLFNRPQSYYLKKLQEKSHFVWLERQVRIDFLRKLDPQNLNGLVVIQEPKRLYHHEKIGGQLIGCTDIDNKGLAGIELAYDKFLHGVDGYVVFQRDGLGKARPSIDYPRVEPVDGNDIVLTIDINLQAIVEKSLARGVETNKAERGLVVVMQPTTGEILALAQYPSVDPNIFGKYNLEDQKLRAVTDLFEPGSIFKIVTASAALEYNLVSASKKFYAEQGEYIISLPSGQVRKISDVNKYEWITFQEAVEYSSNIVMAKISDLIGSERLYKMARDFGFGISTSSGLPGEVKGKLKKPAEWSTTTLNTIAFGYEVGVTPLQITAAYAAIANGGVLMKPYVCMKEIDTKGAIIRENIPQRLRRVISPLTAVTLKNFLEGVVERGTGKAAALTGMKVAGKTGTSKKLVEGHYETGRYIASFAGFFPAEDPQFVCLVMIENPRGLNYSGGMTSAPVFRDIAEHALSTSDVFSSISTSKIRHVNKVSSGELSSFDALKPTTTQHSNSKINAISVVPNVEGFSVRRAIDLLKKRDFHPVVIGSGIVIRQHPVSGEPANSQMKITLVCQPKSWTATTTN
ncbi:MAG TPA: penicillin-binding transpeptidase domain-containing protein [Bacteroidota bacterium]|nr:penicillin-binding transpeptidase domain-containing protein [Bacteroidota bacterium]